MEQAKNENQENLQIIVELDETKEKQQNLHHHRPDRQESKDIAPPIVYDEMEKSEVDSSSRNILAKTKGIAEGMMDIALLTANANQLRFLLTYNMESKTFYISVTLIVLSLIIQVAVGIALIFKSQMKIRGKRHKPSKTNDFLVGGVFLVTVINVFAAVFTTTDTVNHSNNK